MKLFLKTAVILIIAASCGIKRDYPCDEIRSANPIEIAYSTIHADSSAKIKGKVFDENGEPLFGAVVQFENNEMGAYVEMDGKFEINSIPPGTYTLIVRMVGHTNVKYERIEVKEGMQVVLKDIILLDASIELKPILYFYPPDTTALQVDLNYDGKILHTYPESNGSWNMTASPNGTLIDSAGRSYYGIYWEGSTAHHKTINSGFIVDRDETIPFLEEKLAALGLNEREANEFIIFWLPILNQNDRNLIHFDTEHYTQHAVLSINPKPETLIRIMMLHCPIREAIAINPQILPVRPKRIGFTVVEWGGKQINLSQLESQ